MGQDMECITVTVVEEAIEFIIYDVYVRKAGTFEQVDTLYVGQEYDIVADIINNSDCDGKARVKIYINGDVALDTWTLCVGRHASASVVIPSWSPTQDMVGSLQICAEIVDTERC